MKNTTLQIVQNIINTHLSDDRFSVEDLSREAAISKPQLYRKLMAGYGRSANHLIRDIRMEKAKSLLKKKRRSVADVAFATGYSDPDYFGKVFKKVVGFNPSEYKQLYA